MWGRFIKAKLKKMPSGADAPHQDLRPRFALGLPLLEAGGARLAPADTAPLLALAPEALALPLVGPARGEDMRMREGERQRKGEGSGEAKKKRERGRGKVDGRT